MTDEEQRRIFGINLSFQIAQSGKMQKEVAKDLNINPSTLNMWCKGKSIPRVSIVQDLADYFGILKSQLVDRQDNPEKIFTFTEKEKELIIEYRKMPKEVQQMLDRMLNYKEKISQLD